MMTKRRLSEALKQNVIRNYLARSYLEIEKKIEVHELQFCSKLSPQRDFVS